MLKNAQPNFQESPLGLGERLRLRRKECGLTLQAVADGAGLTVGFISQVERDIAAPSLASLTAISEVLGAHISDFFKQPSNKNETTHADLREMYTLPGADISYERLSTNFPGSTITSVMAYFAPNHQAEPMRHRGEELYLLLEGTISIFVDGQETVLRAGDTIHFDSKRLHYVWNRTNTHAKMLICNTMNVFGEDH